MDSHLVITSLPKMSLSRTTKCLWWVYINIPYLFSENRPEEQAFEVNKTLNEKISLWQGDITKLEIDAIVNAGKVILFYHINYGVKQGFPALRKAWTLHMKKYCIFFTCAWYHKSAAEKSLTFCATPSGWWMYSKAFTIHKPRLFVGVFSDYGC